ncbi:thioredoxin-dependent thiol peroxidase [Paenibacillus sp. y28]|uniref:thioredoxin-dependent thiol peroxidase n=1 Tax=Paenibacillus sp. y28 TaxID=3129110 RepID=UPI003018B666
MTETEARVGQPAPDFTLPASGGQQITLSDYRGKKVILYFYPQDNTPTCTQEACEFRDAAPHFAEQNAVIIGISPDSAAKHDKFIAKHGLPFVLLADEEHRVCELYGVWQLKKMYGREYRGVVRSTFLIDEEGRLAQEWRGVRLKGHMDSVLSAAAAENPV